MHILEALNTNKCKWQNMNIEHKMNTCLEMNIHDFLYPHDPIETNYTQTPIQTLSMAPK